MVNFSPHYLLLLAQFFTKTFDSYQVVATCPRPVFGPMAAILAVAAAATAVITPSSTAAVQLRWCSIRIAPWPTVSFCFHFFFLCYPIQSKRHGLMRWWLFLLFLVGRQEKEKKNTWQIEMKESRSLGHCQVNTQGPPQKKNRGPRRERRARDESPPTTKQLTQRTCANAVGAGHYGSYLAGHSRSSERGETYVGVSFADWVNISLVERDSALPRREAF